MRVEKGRNEANSRHRWGNVNRNVASLGRCVDLIDIVSNGTNGEILTSMVQKRGRIENASHTD